MQKRIIITAIFGSLLAIAWWIGRWAAGDPVVAPASVAKNHSRHRAPALPVPKFPLVASKLEAVTTTESILNYGAPSITAAQLAAYLAKHQRSAESLIAASRLTKDLGLAREAAQRFPDDPQVHFELATRSNDPGEKQRAIAELTRTDPANALGPYLAASEAFTAGRGDEAVNQLMAAAERGTIDGYAHTAFKADEEAYRAAGLQPLDAKAAAIYGHSTDFETHLNTLYGQMRTLADSYSANGDSNAAGAVADHGIDLARKLQTIPGQSATGELVGVETEQRFLEVLDPASPLAEDNMTVQQRLDQLAERKRFIKSVIHGLDMSDPSVTPELRSQYLDRLKSEGELQATQWLKGRLGLPVP